MFTNMKLNENKINIKINIDLGKVVISMTLHVVSSNGAKNRT